MASFSDISLVTQEHLAMQCLDYHHHCRLQRAVHSSQTWPPLSRLCINCIACRRHANTLVASSKVWSIDLNPTATGRAAVLCHIRYGLTLSRIIWCRLLTQSKQTKHDRPEPQSRKLWECLFVLHRQSPHGHISTSRVTCSADAMPSLGPFYLASAALALHFMCGSMI